MRTNIRRLLELLVIVCMLTAGGGITAAAAASNNDASGAIVQTYNAGPEVQLGMLVEANPRDSSAVIPLRQGHVKTFLGVVVPAANAPIVLTPEKVVQQQVLVARSGRYNLLVSNQNGSLKAGDYLGLSSVSGIAMKAEVDDEQIIGKADSTFSGDVDVISTTKLKTSNGRSTDIQIGRIPASINVTTNPLFQQPVNYVPGVFAKVATSIADKQVSVGRIYISAAILLLVSIITGSMLYSGVRNGMRAIGRNPLSRKSILRGLIQTTIVGLIIFAAGIFAVYLLLKL